jgi:hypothetical protein
MKPQWVFSTEEKVEFTKVREKAEALGFSVSGLEGEGLADRNLDLVKNEIKIQICPRDQGCVINLWSPPEKVFLTLIDIQELDFTIHRFRLEHVVIGPISKKEEEISFSLKLTELVRDVLNHLLSNDEGKKLEALKFSLMLGVFFRCFIRLLCLWKVSGGDAKINDALTRLKLWFLSYGEMDIDPKFIWRGGEGQ